MENDEWKTLHLPLAVWDELIVFLGRILKVNGFNPEELVNEDRTVRVAARVRAVELLTIIARETPDVNLRND